MKRTLLALSATATVLTGLLITTTFAEAAGFIQLSDITRVGQSTSTVYFSGTGTISGVIPTSKNYTLVVTLSEPMSKDCLTLARSGLLNRALKLTVQSNGTPYTADGYNYYTTGIFQCETAF